MMEDEVEIRRNIVEADPFMKKQIELLIEYYGEENLRCTISSDGTIRVRAAKPVIYEVLEDE